MAVALMCVSWPLIMRRCQTVLPSVYICVFCFYILFAPCFCFFSFYTLTFEAIQPPPPFPFPSVFPRLSLPGEKSLGRHRLNNLRV